MKKTYSLDGKIFAVNPIRRSGNILIDIDGSNTNVGVKWLTEHECELLINGITYPAFFAQQDDTVYIHLSGCTSAITIIDETHGLENTNAANGGRIVAPMPGVVVELLCKQGDTVSQGDTLLMIESMKLQIAIKSEVDGCVTELPLESGASFNKGDMLVTLDFESGEE